MMRKIYVLVFCFFAFKSLSHAQNLNAYMDIKNYFYIFDNGKLVEAEYLPVTNVAVGGNSVAYVDNSSNFKVYFDGESHIEDDNKPDKFVDTDDLVVYEFNKRLSVFDQGKTTVLTYMHAGYAAGDSIVGYFDSINQVLKAYKDGSSKEVENLFGKSPPKSMKPGDNLFAYVNYNDYFKVYFNNRLYELENIHPVSYKCGNNTVAYVDGPTQNFKVFYKGNLITLETFPPTSYNVGDDLIAYVDNQGNFKVYYQGGLFQVSTYEPQYYAVTDNIIVYGDNLNFNVYYQGKSTKLESYVPQAYQLDFNSIAYKDPNNKVRLFSDGVLKDVSNSIVNTFQLTRNVLMYSTDLDDMHFFCNGKNY
jgi:hypothetical protein